MHLGKPFSLLLTAPLALFPHSGMLFLLMTKPWLHLSIFVVVALMLATPAWADLQAGFEAHKRGDYEVAAKEFRPLAADGDQFAQLFLGDLYLSGRGVATDEKEGIKLLSAAAEQGNVCAQLRLGGPEADKRMLRAAEQGFVLALEHLAYEKRDAWGKKFVEALKSEAMQGKVWAQSKLGRMYYEYDRVFRSPFVTPDKAEEFKWYLMAAQRGDPHSQHQVARMYMEGVAVPQNYSEAARWARGAAEQGNGYAQAHLGRMYMKGQGVAKDFVQAHMWLNLGNTASGFGVKERDEIESEMTHEEIGQAIRSLRSREGVVAHVIRE